MTSREWEGFQTGDWSQSVDVRDFITKNYRLYEGMPDFVWAHRPNEQNMESGA